MPNTKRWKLIAQMSKVLRSPHLSYLLVSSLSQAQEPVNPSLHEDIRDIVVSFFVSQNVDLKELIHLNNLTSPSGSEMPAAPLRPTQHPMLQVDRQTRKQYLRQWTLTPHVFHWNVEWTPMEASGPVDSILRLGFNPALCNIHAWTSPQSTLQVNLPNLEEPLLAAVDPNLVRMKSLDLSIRVAAVLYAACGAHHHQIVWRVSGGRYECGWNQIHVAIRRCIEMTTARSEEENTDGARLPPRIIIRLPDHENGTESGPPGTSKHIFGGLVATLAQYGGHVMRCIA
ncbi:MAG: hypothetical protein Q9164_006832 [Protoblastenia rupestris]